MTSQDVKNNDSQDDSDLINTGALWVLAAFLVAIFVIVWLAFVGEQVEIL